MFTGQLNSRSASHCPKHYIYTHTHTSCVYMYTHIHIYIHIKQGASGNHTTYPCCINLYKADSVVH